MKSATKIKLNENWKKLLLWKMRQKLPLLGMHIILSLVFRVKDCSMSLRYFAMVLLQAKSDPIHLLTQEIISYGNGTK